MVILGSLSVANGLQCFQCSNMEMDGSNDFLRSLFKGNTDPGCKSADTSTAGECPQDGQRYKCGYVDAKVTQNVLVGKVSMKVQNRECVVTDQPDGCYTGNQDLKDVANTVLSDMTGVELDGKVCYCSEDLCDAECGGNYWLIGNWCAKKWVLVLLGIASLIVLGLLLSCCCCCCCCCRCCKSTPQGRVIVASTPMMTTTSVNYAPLADGGQPLGIRGMENPGYAIPQAVGPAPTPPAYTEKKQVII